MPDNNQIVFACTGNTCRSPMAEVLFNHFKADLDWSAVSCGLAAFDGDPANRHAIQVMSADYRLDLSNHRSRMVSRDCLVPARLVLTMTVDQRDHLRLLYPDLAEKILTIGEYADEPGLAVPDPYGRELAAYQATAAELARIIKKIVAKIDKTTDPDERQADHHSL